MKNQRSKYWNTMVDILDGQFEKGKCQERGKAIVMLAYIEMMLLDARIGEDGKPIPSSKKGRFEFLKEPLDLIEWILLILMGVIGGLGLGMVLAVRYLI